MNVSELLIGATVELVLPLVVAKDPTGQSAASRAIAQLADEVWLEMASDASSPGWGDLLARLGEVLDDYDDTSTDGEDFLALAANQVGTVLEMLVTGVVDSDRCWQELASIYAALEEYRLEQDLEPFLPEWLSTARSALTDLGAGGSGVDVEQARGLLDAQMASARPFVIEAFASSVADDDW